MRPRWLLCAVVLSGCGPSSLGRTALQEDLPTLRGAIEQAQKKNELDRERVRELAHSVATREITSSTGDAAVARIRELRACVPQLVSELRDRAEADDAGAAAATLALLDAGRGDAEDLFDAHESATDPDWRAVAARAAIGEKRGAYRRAAFLHGDLRVRRAALHAALAMPDERDLDGALEAARLDPDPLVRSLGVRLAGAIGTRRAVAALRDSWPRADVETRQVVVDAWDTPASRANGGSDQILWVMETQGDLPAIVAAVRLSSAQSAHRAAALASLKRAIDHGAVDEQRLAVLLAPADPDLEASIAKLSQSEDAQAAVLAAAALARVPALREQATKRLGELARHAQVRVARQARAALVVLGEQSIVPDLRRELESSSPERRTQAATDLLRLGRHSDVAPVLADPAASVRTRLACAVLSEG